MMFEKERQELVNKLISKGIKDPEVISAINKVPRHMFVPVAMKSHAYKDVALPIGYGQTISQPYTVAFMTQLLEVIPGDKILEIGTGSGYQAAVLYQMGSMVYSIERQFEIYSSTRKLFDALGIRVNTKYGDGTIGWEEYAPYKAIIVTAGSPSVPVSLKKQLDVNGRLVIPVGDKVSQKLKVITRINENDYSTRDIPEFSFVPLIGREGWKDQ
jgi:protein-L-isoaspartate(D-aspartate) O-methyltransferase